MSFPNTIDDVVADLAQERRAKTSAALDDPTVLTEAAQIDPQAWAEFHLIGDCLRSSDLADLRSFRRQQRILAALEAEPLLQAPSVPEQSAEDPSQAQPAVLPRTLKPAPAWWWRYGPGGLAAAAAAALVLVIVPAVQQPSGPAPAGFASAPAGGQQVAPADASAVAAYLHAHRMQSPSSVRPAGFESGLMPVSTGGSQRP